MRKNQNIKIHSAYSALAFATLLGIVGGCAKYEHKNKVLGIKYMDCETAVVLRDLDDNRERLYIDDTPIYKYLVGDTVNVVVRGVVNNCRYLGGRRLNTNGSNYQMCYNPDSLWSRMTREKFNTLNNQSDKEK